MAEIQYRISTSAPIPVSTTAKGSSLTHVELDGNFRSIATDLTTKATTAQLATKADTSALVAAQVQALADAVSMSIALG